MLHLVKKYLEAKMKRQSLIMMILGGIFIVLSTIWYLVIYPGNDIVGATGYVFLLLSSIVFFGGLALAQLLLSKKKNIFGSTPFMVLLAYFLISLLLSLVFMLKPVEKKAMLMVIQILLMALAVLSLFLLLAAENSTPSMEFSKIQWNDPLRESINKIRALKDDPENTPYKEILSRLYERSVFLDTSLKREEDEALFKGIKELEITLLSMDYQTWEKQERVEASVKRLEDLLKKREYEIRKSPWTKQ